MSTAPSNTNHRETALTLYREALRTFDWNFEFIDGNTSKYYEAHAQLQKLYKVQRELDPTGAIWMEYKPNLIGCPFPRVVASTSEVAA